MTVHCTQISQAPGCTRGLNDRELQSSDRELDPIPGFTYGAVVQVHFVAEHDKREVVGVARTGLYQELVPPRVERPERVGTGHVVDEHTTVGTAVEGHTERLEALLAGRVPDLPADGVRVRRQSGHNQPPHTVHTTHRRNWATSPEQLMSSRRGAPQP